MFVFAKSSTTNLLYCRLSNTLCLFV